MIKTKRPKAASGVADEAEEVDLEKKPGRAFKHLLTGLYLAESGQVKFHAASGHRSSLVLRKQPEPTSYWVEEHEGKGSEIYYYK